MQTGTYLAAWGLWILVYPEAAGTPMTTDPKAKALQSLRDIDGVYGSFVLNSAGAPTARDLPAVFDDATLSETGSRIVRLCEAVSESGPPEYVLLEFSEYSLFLRPIGGSCLCVVVPSNVNVLALRFASKWAARHFDPNALSS